MFYFSVFSGFPPCKLRIKNINFRGLFTCPVPRTLAEVAKLPLLSRLGPKRLEFVWNKQFEPRQDVVVTTLHGNNYELFSRNNRKFPMFIAPIVKQSGFENLIWQFIDEKCALITSLETFKQKGQNSCPLMIFTAFDELYKTHDISLLRLDIINNYITKQEANSVLANIIKFYINEHDFQWVKRFNGEGEEFNFLDFKDNYRELYTFKP